MTSASSLPHAASDPRRPATDEARAAEIRRALVDLRSKLEAAQESLGRLEDEVEAATDGTAGGPRG